MRKKLRSQQGIAMIFAIAGFAVVMVIGVTFLTAGYANYSKLFGRKNDRQDYYTLVSAAKYAGSQLDGATIRFAECCDDENGEEKKVEPAPDPEFGGQSEWITALIREIYENRENVPNVTYGLSFSDGGAYNESLTAIIRDFDLESKRFMMTLTTGDGKSSVQIEFVLESSCGYTEAVVTKEDKEIPQKIHDVTYTIRMGDIRTVNGGSGS